MLLKFPPTKKWLRLQLYFPDTLATPTTIMHIQTYPNISKHLPKKNLPSIPISGFPATVLCRMPRNCGDAFRVRWPSPRLAMRLSQSRRVWSQRSPSAGCFTWMKTRLPPPGGPMGMETLWLCQNSYGKNHHF